MVDSTAARQQAEERDKRALDSMSEQRPGEAIEPVGPTLNSNAIGGQAVGATRESQTDASAIATAQALAKTATRNAATCTLHAPSPETVTATPATPAVETLPEPCLPAPPAAHPEPAADAPGMPPREELMLAQAEIREDLLRNFLGRHDGKPLICVAFALVSCAAYMLEHRYSRAFAASALAKMARGVERGTIDYDGAEAHRAAQTVRGANGDPGAAIY